MPAIGQNGAISVREELFTKTPADILATNKSIYIPAYNNTAVNQRRDESTIDELKGFIDGTPITVTWFHQITSNSDNSSNTTAVSFLSSSTNTSFLRINNMEIRLAEGMDYAFDTEVTTSTLSGTARTYPGITVKMGDFFLYQYSPGKVGLFKISSNPTRLSIHNNTSHVVEFSLLKTLTDEDYAALQERTRDVAYFDKQRFLQEDGALLTHAELVDVTALEKTRTKLLHYYHDEFFSDSYSTFLLKDKLYDPIITNFFIKTVGAYSNKKYVKLLTKYDKIENWEASLFGTLLGENPTTIQYGRWSTVISALHGKEILELDPNGTEEYVSSTVFAFNTNDTGFDTLVSLYMMQNTLSTNLLKQELSAAIAMDKELAYFRLPILLYLCNIAINAIHTGSSVNMINRDVKPYINIPFTATECTDGVVSIATVFTTILAIVDNNDEIFNIDDSFVTVSEVGVEVDISDILLAKGITEIEGTWNLVTNNHLLVDA